MAYSVRAWMGPGPGQIGLHYIMWKFSNYNFSCTCTYTLELDQSRSWSISWSRWQQPTPHLHIWRGTVQEFAHKEEEEVGLKFSLMNFIQNDVRVVVHVLRPDQPILQDSGCAVEQSRVLRAMLTVHSNLQRKLGWHHLSFFFLQYHSYMIIPFGWSPPVYGKSVPCLPRTYYIYHSFRW